MATPEPLPKKARTGLGRLANASIASTAITAVNDVLVCVICEKTSKSEDPGRGGMLLDFPRKKACSYCLYYYMNMFPHIEWAVLLNKLE